MTTPLSSIILYLVAAFLGALGQILYKEGAERSSGDLLSYIFNIRLLGGVFCYICVMVFFVAALKRGGSLTVLYPLYATTFIWGAIIGQFYYDTPIKVLNVGGMLLIVCGMYLMGR